MKPPSLQKLIVDAAIPVELGRKTRGMVKDAPAAKVEPIAGKFEDVNPFPTVVEVTLWYGWPVA